MVKARARGAKMKVGEACNRSVVVVEEDESALAAAKLMREYHVGDLVIVRSTGSPRVPVGIVTDRDLVLEVLALEVDPDSVEVKDLVTSERLVTASEDDEFDSAVQMMRDYGVRRLPVVNDDGSLVGILTADDSLEIVCDELQGIVHLELTQSRREQRAR